MFAEATRSNALPGTSYSVQTASSLSGGTNWVDYVQIYASNAVNANLIIALNPPAGIVLIPAGEFTMENYIGDSDITDANPTTVTASAFYIDTTLVTYSQCKTVYSYATNHGYAFDDTGAGKAANHLVHTVDWYDCVKWCNARSEKEGQVPAYYMDAGLTHVYTNGVIDAVYANWSANGYRLPTEAEWEKAACGGLSGRRFPWGDTIRESHANYYGVSSFNYDLGPNGYNAAFHTGGFPYTSPVDSFAANGYGLYDMTGNVFAWCWDWYGTPYGQPTTTNPTGPVTPSFFRMLRGGNWNSYATNARCAARNSYEPDYAYFNVGFRCVLGV